VGYPANLKEYSLFFNLSRASYSRVENFNNTGIIRPFLSINIKLPTVSGLLGKK
jgi:hypothetical protein